MKLIDVITSFEMFVSLLLSNAAVILVALFIK